MTARESPAAERLERLEDTYAGRTLLIVSCGPSAKHWREVRSTLPGDTVIGCVKQAIFLCGKEASLHFFNAYNAQRYWPHNRKALRVDVEWREPDGPPSFNSGNLVFSFDPTTAQDVSCSVASTGRFEDYTIQRTGLVRPWGPGIMYDVVLYLAVFLGFRRIHTIGWDVVAEPVRAAENALQISHFYDPHEAAKRDGEMFEWLGQDPRRYRRQAYLRHLRGLMYNRMPKTDSLGEVRTIVKALPRLFEWLEAEGTSLTVHSQLRGNAVDAAVRPHVVDLSKSS
jgi:hypothetical protein